MHSLVLLSNGTLYNFRFGCQLGQGERVQLATPKRIEGSLSSEVVIGVSAGGTHSIAVTAHGQVYSFGENSNGQLGHGDRRDQVECNALTSYVCCFACLCGPVVLAFLHACIGSACLI